VYFAGSLLVSQPIAPIGSGDLDPRLAWWLQTGQARPVTVEVRPVKVLGWALCVADAPTLSARGHVKLDVETALRLLNQDPHLLAARRAQWAREDEELLLLLDALEGDEE